MRYCPLQRYRIFKIVAALVAAAMIIVSSIVALTGISRAQAAGVLCKDLPEGAPKQGIVIDDKSKFYTIRPTFTPSNSNLKMIEQSWWFNDGYTFLYEGQSPASSSCGEFTLRWNNIATDQDGDAVDIVMRVSNIIGYGVANPAFLTIYNNGWIEGMARTWAAPYDSTTQGYGHISFDAEYFMYKSDGTGTSTVPANGDWVIQYTDLDQGGGYPGLEESVRLLANYGEEIHLIPDDMKLPNRGHDVGGCWLDIQDLDGDPLFACAAGRLDDGGTLHTGLCVSAKNGYKFRWNGHDCGTSLNEFYGQKNIEAIAHAGGSITDEGTTEVAWKHDKTYTAQADKYHTISSVVIDGQTLDVPAGAKTFDYTFTEVIVDHKIEVSFVPIPASLSYDANLPSATGSTDGWTGDAGSEVKVAASGFVAEGYEFSHWNTEPDGTGTTYKPEDLITVKRQGEVLYAQWTPLDLSVKWIDTITGGTVADYSVKVGNDSPIPDIPSHRGHDFTHLSGDRWNNITHDSVIYINYASYAYDIPSYSNSGYNGFTFKYKPPVLPAE